MNQAQAIAKMQTKASRREGAYPIQGGWTHSKDSGRVFEDRNGAETDYRFCCEWERG